MRTIKKNMVGVLSFCTLLTWQNETSALNKTDIESLRNKFRDDQIAEACLLNSGDCFNKIKNLREKFRLVRMNIKNHMSSTNLGKVHFSMNDDGSETNFNETCHFLGNYQGVMKKFFDYVMTQKHGFVIIETNIYVKAGVKQQNITIDKKDVTVYDGKVKVEGAKIEGAAMNKQGQTVSGKVIIVGFSCDVSKTGNENSFHPHAVVVETKEPQASAIVVAPINVEKRQQNKPEPIEIVVKKK
jgi:hypothetical protein